MQEVPSTLIPYKSAKRRATAVKVMLGVFFVSIVLSIISEAIQIRIYSGETNIMPTDPNILQASTFIFFVSVLRTTVFGITVIFFAMWIYRIYQNLSLLGAKNLRMTPGWAVGWYFIPIANLFKPYQGMKDAWNACDLDSRFENDSWSERRGASLIKWWWAFWWLSFLIIKITTIPQTIDNVIMNLKISIGLTILDLISTVLAYLVVTRLTERQEQKWQAVKNELQHQVLIKDTEEEGPHFNIQDQSDDQENKE